VTGQGDQSGQVREVPQNKMTVVGIGRHLLELYAPWLYRRRLRCFMPAAPLLDNE
jgi:hypothetical protein